MSGVHCKILVVAASMLLSSHASQAVGSDVATYRHIEVAPTFRLPQVRPAGSTAIKTVQSTKRLLSQVPLARGVFLVAKRRIQDPRFKQTIILIVGHDSWGSVGLVVNRPSKVPVVRLVPEWSGLIDDDAHVYYGGPVELDLVRFLIRSSRPLEIGNRVLDDVYMVAGKTTFDTFLRDRNPNSVMHAYIGYAGWAVGQLEHEVDRGDWYVIEGDASTLFDGDPETLWKQLIRMLSGNWVHYRPGSEAVAPGPFFEPRISAQRIGQVTAASGFELMAIDLPAMPL